MGGKRALRDNMHSGIGALSPCHFLSPNCAVYALDNGPESK